MTTDSPIPASHVCLMACDMPRQLAAAFVSEVCSSDSPATRHAAAYLERVELPELGTWPEALPDEAVAQAARLLATCAGHPDSDVGKLTQVAASCPDLPLLIELIKLDHKIRWSRGTPVFVEWYLERLPELRRPDTLQDLLRSECLARRFFDRLPEFHELAARFPEIAGSVDLAALNALVSDLEHSPALFQLCWFSVKWREGALR